MRGWTRQAASIVVLCTFAGLPVATAACALVCRAAETSAARGRAAMMAHHHHHDAVQATDEPSTLLHLRAGSTADHECLTDEGVLPQGEPTMKPLPQGGGVARLARGPTASSLASGLLASMHAFDDSGPHSSPAPISATALVLRV